MTTSTKESRDEKNVIGSKGGKVTLPCVAKLDSSNYFLEWKKQGIDTIYTYYFGTDRGQPAVGFEGRLSHGSDGSLFIHTVAQSDAGLYWCVLKTFDRPADNVIGQKINLAVHTLPYFVSVPSDEIFQERGQSVSLTCEADGVPTPSVSWSKSNQTIRPAPGRIITGDGKLEILKLEEGDDGKYICTAENSVGAQTHVTNLRFAQPAFFEEQLKNRTAIDGSSLIWKCRAKALPPDITYTWFFEQREVTYSESLGLRAKVQGGDLSISSIRREDKGWYKCTVSNGYGSVKVSSAYLDVHYAPEISRLNPPLQYVPFGLPAAVKCDVDANPPASDVTWTKDGRYLNPTEDPRLSVTDNGTRLRIETVDGRDKGLYTCQAFNYLGGGNNYEIHVFVEEPPYYVKEPAERVTKKQGETVEFECAAGGKVPPKISWRRKNGNPLPERAEIYGNKNLRIRNLTASDHGIYQCVVENRVTVLSKESYLIIEDTIPQAPEDVVVNARAFEAEISWNPGYGGRRNQYYILKYRKSGNLKLSWNTVDVKNATRYVVTHLHPDTSYEFVILPRNELGPGFATQAFRTKTKGAADIGPILPTDTSGITYFPAIERPIGPRPYPPKNLVVANQHHKVLFMWEPPRSQVVRVHYFSVEYKENLRYARKRTVMPKEDRKWKGFRTLKDQIRDTRLEVLPGGGRSSLHPGETYDFRVRAHSVASFSEPSNTVTYTVPGISSQTAVVAGIVGGILFLLLFLLLGCFLVMRARERRKAVNRRKHNGNAHAYANGHTPQSHHANFDTVDLQYTLPTLCDGNGPVDVPRDKGVSSMKERIITALFRMLTDCNISSYFSRASQHFSFYTNSRNSEPPMQQQSEPDQQERQQKVPDEDDGGFLDSSSLTTAASRHDSDLAEYLSLRDIRNYSSISAGNRSFESMGVHSKNFPSHSLGRGCTVNAQKRVTFAPELTLEEQNRGLIHFQPRGHSGYVFGPSEQKDLLRNSNSVPGRHQYTRENLLGTIDKLRKHVNHDAPPAINTNSDKPIPRYLNDPSHAGVSDRGTGFVRNPQRHSYTYLGNKNREPTMRCHSTCASASRSSYPERLFNGFMSREGAGSGCSSSSGVTSIQNSSFSKQNGLTTGVMLPPLLEQAGGASPSSSSGISSDEGPTGNPITEMLQEKYIYCQGVSERAVDCGKLEEEEELRFRKLRDEFRVARQKCFSTDIKANVVESEVL